MSPESMDREALLVEVRRLALRLDALREQRDERIAQIQALEQQLSALDDTLRAVLPRAERGVGPATDAAEQGRAGAGRRGEHALLRTRACACSGPAQRLRKVRAGAAADGGRPTGPG
jgi:hypothetical protein